MTSIGARTSRDGAATKSAYLVQAVSRAATVLEAFESADSLSLVELSQRTRLPKPSVFRLAASLEAVGLLDKDPDGRYSLGLKLVTLARVVLSRSVGRSALPVMQELQRSSGHSVSLATLSNGEVVFLETLESTSSFRIASALGAREAVHCTSVGKAMAAYLPTEELDRLLSEHPMRPSTPNTITSRPRFEQELAVIRSRGFATDIGECHIGAHGVGAAIFDRHGLAGGISISAPSSQMPEDEFPAIGGALRDAARRLTLDLGGDSSIWNAGEDSVTP